MKKFPSFVQHVIRDLNAAFTYQYEHHQGTKRRYHHKLHSCWLFCYTYPTLSPPYFLQKENNWLHISTKDSNNINKMKSSKWTALFQGHRILFTRLRSMIMHTYLRFFLQIVQYIFLVKTVPDKATVLPANFTIYIIVKHIVRILSLS